MDIAKLNENEIKLINQVYSRFKYLADNVDPRSLKRARSWFKSDRDLKKIEIDLIILNFFNTYQAYIKDQKISDCLHYDPALYSLFRIFDLIQKNSIYKFHDLIVVNLPIMANLYDKTIG